MSATRITWRDALLMPEDGKRYEAIDGDLYVTPAPKPRHAWISYELVQALHRLLVEPGHGRVFYAPVGVEFPASEEGVQPDILFIAKDRLEIVGEDWTRGAPDLVIEILSPSTAERDRTVKLKLYQRQGVGEYWIVDPETKVVEVWTTGATKPLTYADRLPVRLGDTVVGAIDLADIFQYE
jgi:Uma2 family endonuclease